MSKKVHSSGYPRKFIDKIALIKQKEALTNAYFESAIQGLSDISMKRVNTVDGKYLTEIKTKILTNDNINKLKDDFSNTSYSPESFTSDSTINNYQNNDYFKVKETNNDEMKCLYENQNPERNVFENVQSYGSVKFRHLNENSSPQFQQARLSNIEGYPNFKILSRDLNDQVCSGSLPDVSSFNNQNSMEYESVFSSDRLSNPCAHYQDIHSRDTINLKEALSTLKKVKKEANSKKALFEHLKNRGLQSHGGSHPHSVLAAETPPNLASMLGSPSMNRNRPGYIHNYDGTVNSMENGHLKPYSSSKNPYLSLPVRDLQCNKDCDNSYRKRHASGNVISPQNHMELNLNCHSNTKDNSFKYKSLTPTETLQCSLFNNSNDGQLLSPVVYGMISADYRRVASDSSIQKSLKQCTNISQSNFSFNNEENVFGKVRNNKEDSSTNVYQRMKSMTSEPTNPGPNPFNETQKHANYLRDISTSSSFLDSYISQNSPDENIDPNIDALVTPDKFNRQTFKFPEFKKLPEETHIANSNTCSCSNDVINSSQALVSQQSFNTFVYNEHGPNFETILETQNSNFPSDFTHPTDNNDQCYWTQPDESKEPSPKIKPCENLDPLNVALDLNTDFSCIPDITLNDEDAQRRDSLNMADEVLNNLNVESNNSEFNSFRDKWLGFSNFYQPMDMLSEEVSIKDCENEY